MAQNFLGIARRDHHSSALAALRTQVDDPVRGLDHVELMFDHHHSVAQIHKAVQHVEQLTHVLEMQTGGRLIQNVQRFPGLPPAQLARELDALGFAAGKRGRRLPQVQISEADFDQRLQLGFDLRNIFE